MSTKGMTRPTLSDHDEAILDGWEDQYDGRTEQWEIAQINGTLKARCLVEEDSQGEEGDSLVVTFPVHEMAEMPPSRKCQLAAGPADNPHAQLRYEVTRASYAGSPIARLTIARI